MEREYLAAIAVEPALAAFVPQDRRSALAEARALPERSTGAALFADLSGFTRLTERLARSLGPLRGAEELSAVLREVYEALIAEVERVGGSVLGFSGDAITCWLDGDDGTLALRAAHAMQAQMASARNRPLPDGTTTGLKVKVAVAVGAVSRFVVGDPSIQEMDVLAGATLEALAAAEHMAEAGEVVMACTSDTRPPFLEIRHDPDSGLAIGVVAPQPVVRQPMSTPAVPDIDALVASWVPHAVRERLQRGLGAFLAGFRPAAALFLSFRGIDYDGDPAAGAKLDAFVRRAQRIIDDHGGTLVQLTMGDKGSYLYAAFGAPVAHEDDAVRAVAAARALLAGTVEPVREVRIGLTHGAMFAGTYGSHGRCTYGVLGPMTNLAARLMTAAGDGEVLCNPSLARLAARRFRMEERGSRRLKGVAEPVAVFAPVAETLGAGSEASPMLGREAELAALVDALGHVRDGAPPVIVIEAEAGLGKTRMLGALATEAERLGMTVLRGAARAAGPEQPYGAWKSLVTDALGLPAEELSATAAETALAGLDPALTGYLPVLDDILGLGIPHAVDLEGEQRRNLLTEAVMQVMAARARLAPLAVLVDDGHRLDGLSADLLTSFIERTRRDATPAAVVIGRRPDEAQPAIAEAVNIGLSPLPGAVLDRVVAHQLGVPAEGVPEALRSLLSERGSGNPMVAESLVQHLLSESLLRLEQRADGARYRLEGSKQDLAAVPGTLRGLLLSRIDHLDPGVQLALKVAAVVGRDFTVDPVRVALERVAGTPERTTRVSIGMLSERGLVDAALQDDHYRFRQALAQEVAYETLLFAQRRAFHRELAAWFRAQGSRDVSTLAHHAYHAAVGSDEAELLAHAAEAQVALARTLIELGAYQDAVGVTERGLALLPDAPRWAARRATLMVQLGTVHQHLSRYDDAEQRLSEGLSLAQSVGAHAMISQALDTLCMVATRRGKFEDAKAFAQRSLTHAGDTADRGGEARARSRLGILAAYRGAFDEAAEQYGRAIALAEELGDQPSASSSLSNLGLVKVYQKHYEEARPLFQRALRMAERLESRHLKARFVTNLGLVDEHLGDLDAAEQHYREGLAWFEELGARQEALVNVLNLGELAMRRGRAGVAREAYRRALSEGMALGALPLVLSAVGGLAWAKVRDGEPERGAELLGTTLAHPARDAEVEQHGAMVLEEIRGALESTAVEAALERGRATSLEDVARLECGG